MSSAVAEGATATAPVERGWRGFVVALVAMVAVTAIPLWPPALALQGGLVRLLLPIEQFALLVLVATASCAVVGWWAGGKLLVAAAWVAIAGWLLWKVPLSPNGYGAFARGWAMMLGASFGLVCFATASRPFLTRALAAVALTAAVALIGTSSRKGAGSSARFLDSSASMLGFEYQRRVDESLASWRRRTESPVWQAFAQRLPEAANRAGRSAVMLGVLGQSPSVTDSSKRGPMLLLVPALLALESILALALGWAVYHRLSRTRIGPPLGAVRDLRFSDQWLWGLVVGFTLMLLPTLADWRPAGLNLVVFFGALYALRGTGVFLWWLPKRLGWLLPLTLAVLIPIFGAVKVVIGFPTIAFGVGIGDTWRDLRNRAVTYDRQPRS